MENNILDKQKLISELRDIHDRLVNLYNDIFNYKLDNSRDFSNYINEQYKQNNISRSEQKAWNENFCHRASYTLLNKILFVRICEDKGFMRNPGDYIAGEISDPHIGEKLSKKGLQKWTSIISNYTFGELIEFAFLDMKKSYNNIVLYKENKYEILNPTDKELELKFIEGDSNTKKFVLGFEKILSDIIEKLDTEKFDFAKTDSNILGDVYEQFMDRDTRKAIGQFYTPEFIIEYILKNTVEEANVVENPYVTVADISCGSGHFLIMAYDILREKFIDNLEELRDRYSGETYKITKGGKEEYISGKEYWIKENIHYHLLKHCIYGADIDSFAVQLTTINLLLKDLDNFTDELNIIECDSLIKWEEDYDWKDLKEQLKEQYEIISTTQINLFGEKEKLTIKDKKEIFNLKYRDLFGIERVEEINRKKGEEIVKLCEFWNRKFDYIVGNPPYFTVDDDIKKKYYLEKYKSAKFKIDVYTLFIERGIIKTKSNGLNSYITPNSYLDNYYCRNLRDIMLKYKIINLAILSNGVFEDAVVHPVIYVIQKSECLSNKIKILNNFGNVDEESYDIDQENFLKNSNHEFIVSIKGPTELIIEKIKDGSKQLKDLVNITQTIKTGNDKKYLHTEKKKENFKPVLRGRDIARYQKRFHNIYLDYGDWLRVPRNPKFFEQEKLLIREAGNRVTATYDNENFYTMSSLYVVNKLDSSVNLKLILGILNSTLIQFYMKNMVYDKTKGAFTKARIFHLDQIPIKKFICEELQKQLIELVSEMLYSNEVLMNLEIKLENKFEKEIFSDYSDYYESKYQLKNRIEELDKEIDKLVYKIYEIDEKEINIIEDYVYEVNLSNNKFGKKQIDYETFIRIYFDDEEDLESIYEYYDITYEEMISFLKRTNKQSQDKEICFNTQELILNIYDYLREKCELILKSGNNYMSISDIKNQLNDFINNFDSLTSIVRRKEPMKKSLQIIKESINKDAFTWNAYRKAKKSDKVNETFIKYYDSSYYGLAEWSDEIHKQYFMYAIEEYTVNKPNEKKAKDILKLFKDLDIIDKQDYIEIIESKINRAFK